MERILKGGRFSDSEWSRILRRSLLILKLESYIKGREVLGDSERSCDIKEGRFS